MIDILQGDCRDVLATLPAASVQCVVTSPPYFNLRNYGVDRQIGLEASPNAYVAEMVNVFQAVRRVLRDDGTCWLNLGDTTKNKQLQMVPARVALALQADGWWLRSQIIWAKPNPMPESVRDRPTNAHESVFLLTKRPTYFYDADAVREEAVTADHHARYAEAANGYHKKQPGQRASGMMGCHPNGRNCRNVWTIVPKPYRGSHFATMPPDLVERCIKAGSRPGDTVLDPFFGAGTTGLVASRLGRSCIGIELNPDYCTLARARIDADAGLLAAD